MYMDALCQVSAVLKHLGMGTPGYLECRPLSGIVTDQYTTNITVIKRVIRARGNLPIHLVVCVVLLVNLCLSVLQFLTNLPRWLLSCVLNNLLQTGKSSFSAQLVMLIPLKQFQTSIFHVSFVCMTNWMIWDVMLGNTRRVHFMNVMHVKLIL